MKKYSLKKGIALLLCAALLMGLPIPAHAEDMENILFSEVDNTAVSATPGQEIPEISTVSEEISPSESVRVSVVLERAPTMQVFSDENPADGGPAASYRQELREMQDDLTAGIEEELGHPLDVVWNLTLAANAISANVPYGEIELIQEVPGVAQVIVETRHDPMFTDAEEEPPADPLMAISTHMMGSNIAWQSG